MTGAGGDHAWKVLALIDRSRPDATQAVNNALALASCLRGDLTLVSLLGRRFYGGGLQHGWPQNAFGEACADVDIHRVLLTGAPTEAISAYADQIRADLLALPAEYQVRRWFRNAPFAEAVATQTSRYLAIVPTGTRMRIAAQPLRAACVMRLDETDGPLCMAAQTFLQRCGGEIVLTHLRNSRLNRSSGRRAALDRSATLEAMSWTARSLAFPWSTCIIDGYPEDALIAGARIRKLDLIVAGRGMYSSGSGGFVNLLPLAKRLPCPLLSIPFSSGSTNPSIGSANARTYSSGTTLAST